MEMTTVSLYNNTTAISETNETVYIDQYVKLRQSLHIMSLIVYSLAFVLGVLGNGAVIWVTGFKMKKTVNTVWFLNLAVADFLFTVSLPLSVTYLALRFHWPFGKFMCKLNSTLNSLNIFVSVYILVVISVDRCVSVVWPVWAQNHRNVRKASYVSLGVWVLGLILSSPYFVFRDTGPSFMNKDIINCFNNFALSDDYESLSVYELTLYRFKAMTITRFLLGFVVPFTVIVSCYAVIIHHVRRNRTLARQSKRTFKIIAAVITTFFFCWAPFHAIALIDLVHYLTEYESQKLDYVITIGVPLTTSLAFLNSCLNPLLYVFVGQDFRDKVRKSILNVLETAFQEDSGSQTDTHTVSTSQSKGKSAHDTEVFREIMEMTTLPDYENTTADPPYTTDAALDELSQSLKCMSLIVYCLAFVLGVLGNGAVIWVTGFKMKKTVNTVWFLNLAVADFLFIVSLPLSVTYLALDFHWPFGKFMCKLNSTLNSLNIFVSVYILVVISVDRCVSVVRPVWAQNHRNVRKASCVSLGVWVLALVLSTPDFVFRNTQLSSDNHISCFSNFAFPDESNPPVLNELVVFRFQVMTITRFLLGFVVPFTVIVSCYAVIIHRLRRNCKMTRMFNRTFKIIAAVILTFFFCWAPFYIFVLLDLVSAMNNYADETLGSVVYIGTPIVTSLAFLNSCLNPLLYVFVGQDFRDRIHKSVLSALEAAFQEELSRSRFNSNTEDANQINERSLLSTKV
ncbi:uncharacterized protein LOC121513510 [Cheilinus undulatus]|uniref:uncharacterized protein LOC121513510 n=1 Tax=Cheilinus undulatus TaxID=241271 RepID=UPI001BD62463|nr:uncharacterized protein LOC121513510 [Cheilinus undulatus]